MSRSLPATLVIRVLASRSLHTCIVLRPYSVTLSALLHRCVPSRSATHGCVMCTGVGVHDRGLPVRQLHAVCHRPIQPLRVVQSPSLQPGHGRGGEPVHHPQQHVVHCRLSHAARYVRIACPRGAGGWGVNGRCGGGGGRGVVGRLGGGVLGGAERSVEFRECMTGQ